LNKNLSSNYFSSLNLTGEGYLILMDKKEIFFNQGGKDGDL